MAAEKFAPSVVRRADGSWISLEHETLVTHFLLGELMLKAKTSVVGTEGNCTLFTFIRGRKLAVDSLKPFKSSGRNGIYPALLQHLKSTYKELLGRIFETSMQPICTPWGWLKVKMVFISKAGKSSYTTSKDYRPINPSSILLYIYIYIYNR